MAIHWNEVAIPELEPSSKSSGPNPSRERAAVRLLSESDDRKPDSERENGASIEVVPTL